MGTIRQNDVKKAVKGALAAGMQVGKVEVNADGTIIIVAGPEPAEPSNDFDRWKRNHARQTQGH